MKLFGLEIRRSKAAASRGGPVRSRGRPPWYNPFAAPRALSPQRELATFGEMRRLFPILDTAIARTVGLVGAVSVTGSRRLVEDLEAWMGAVRVNQAERGLPAFLGTHLESLLVYGKAVGEIVPRAGLRDVYGVQNLDTLTIELAQGDTPHTLRIWQRQSGAPWRVELDPALTLFAVRGTEGRDPNGRSLFRSLPFVATTLSIIQNATAQVWERQGAPSFHVNWQPEEGFSDPDGSLAKSFLDAIANEFQTVMEARRSGEIRDFYSSGEVSIDAIGSEAQLLAIQEPFRAFTEQMVAPTNLPPWLLGLHWSSTERLSTQQADLIIAYIGELRAAVAPQLEYLFDLRQRMVGRPGKFTLKWSDVTLRDLTETARGEAWQQQARSRRIENGRRMWELGYWTQLRAAQDADPALSTVAREMESPVGTPPPGGALSPAGDRGVPTNGARPGTRGG